MTKTLFKKIKAIDPEKDQPFVADILVKNGLIYEISNNISESDCEIIENEDLILTPGFIDTESHICKSWKDIDSTLEVGTRSALKGGFTTICVMPDTIPALDNEGMIGIIRMLSEQKGWVKVIPAGSATRGLEGEAISEIGTLISAGAGLIYDAGNSMQNMLLLRRLMEYSSMFDSPLFLSCYNKVLNDEGLVNESAFSSRMGLPGLPSVAEDIAVSAHLLLAEYLNVSIHLTQISTASSVRMISEAKKRGVKVTASVSPHHLDLTEDDISGYNTNFKVYPPLRSRIDRDALVKGIKDNVIDIIATAHRPCSSHAKSREFALAPFGFIGLETAFSVVYKRLVKDEGLSLNFLIKKLTSVPSQILGLKQGFLRAGSPADLVLINTESSRIISPENLVSSAKNSPYLGKTIPAFIDSCMVDGKFLFKEGTFLHED